MRQVLNCYYVSNLLSKMTSIRKRQVKCQHCGNLGYNTEFYCIITPNNKRSYYCDEQCYNSMTYEKKLLIECKYFILEILDCHPSKQFTTYMDKRLKEYDTINKLESLHYILFQRKENLFAYLEKIDFRKNNIAKFKYLIAMIHLDVEKDSAERERLSKQVVQHVEPTLEMKTSVKKGRDISEFI